MEKGTESQELYRAVVPDCTSGQGAYQTIFCGAKTQWTPCVQSIPREVPLANTSALLCRKGASANTRC